MQNKRKCPVCTSLEHTTLYTQNFANNVNYHIALCNICGFSFINNSPSQSYYSKYYKLMSKYEFERDELLHGKYIKILQKFIDKSMHILDIGCSTGHFLYMLKKNGYQNLSGIDPSPKCKILAKEKYNISIESKDLFSLSAAKKYNVITLNAVLEHLVEVRNAIKKVRELLVDGGYIFISVPDAGEFYQSFDEPFGEFSIEHINFFTQNSLYQVMNGFTCCYLKSDKKVIYSLWKKDKTAFESMDAYIKISEKKLKNVQKVVNKAPSRIIVWGAGSLTQRLLQSTNLSKKILMIVDRDKNLIGKKLNGIKIMSPLSLIKYKEPILIVSFRFKDEIRRDIKAMKLRNKIITF